MTDMATAARVAAMAAEDDPTLKERVQRAIDRMGRLEESVALLMNQDVTDVPMADPAPNDQAVTAAPVSQDRRDTLTDQGHAMPDGSYPIGTHADLKAAVQAFGRAKDPAAVKRHIKQRARELHAQNVLPESW